MNNYENPQLYGVDYTVIDKNVDKAVEGISKSMASLAEQRRLAYEKLKNDYSKYQDLTYIERAKGLDEASNEAIRQSVDVNLVDFSNLSEYDKSKNIQFVKDAKIANQAMEKMINLKNSGATINKNTSPEYYNFLMDLSSMDGEKVKFVPLEGQIGYKVIHKTDKGENEYSMSELTNMSEVFFDTSEMMDKMLDILDETADKAQVGVNNLSLRGGKYNKENLRGEAQSIVKMMGAEEKEILFSEMVNPFQNFVPSIDANGNPLSEKEIASIEVKNTKLLEDFIVDYMDGKIQEPPPPKTTGGSNRGSGDEPRPEDLQEATEFKKRYFEFYASGEVKPLNQYLSSMQMRMKENEDGTYDVFKKIDLSQIQDLEGFAKTDEVTGESLKEEKIGTIDPEDPMEFYRAYQYAIAQKSKKSVLDLNPWVSYITSKKTDPSEDFIKQKMEERRLRLSRMDKIRDEITTPQDILPSGRTNQPSKEKTITLKDGRKLPSAD